MTAGPSTSSDSSADDEIGRDPPADHDAPPVYPKIPPPPSEHPPPYTPFGGQTATLLPQGQGSSTSQPSSNQHPVQNRNPRVVNPPGIRKYLQHITPRNILIGIAAFIGLVVFVFFVHWSNQSDEELLTPKGLEGTKPLDVGWLALGEYNKSLDRLSYDEASDSVVVSQYYRENNLLKCETVDINDHLSGFREFTRNITKAFEDCICFTERVYCCSTPSDSRHHQTECYLTENGETLHSVAVMFDFVPKWQSLSDGEKLLIVHNRQRNSILDLKSRRVLRIEENRLPREYISAGFFFPMDSAEEVEELVRSGDEFRLCEYLKTNNGDYALKDENCVKTPFTVEFELPKVAFCSNPLYTAVIQYGHLSSEPKHLTWHLRVKYDSSPDVYSAAESFEATLEELVFDCNDKELDIFVLGTHELHQYTITLPNLRSEHFIQTRNV